MMYPRTITMVKVCEPKDIIGKDFIRKSGQPIPKCGFFSEGAQFIVPETGVMPEKFIISMPFSRLINM